MKQPRRPTPQALRRRLSRKQVLLSLLAGPGAALIRLSPGPASTARADTPDASTPSAGALPARVSVSAIANGGRFLGDDIGDAQVTIRDADTGQVLASGRTHGGSGPPDLMTVQTTRSQPIPDSDAATFETTLMLNGPRLVEIVAYGPLAALGSSARASVTRWLLPSGDPTALNRVVLTLDGLVVQILNPPTHFLSQVPAPLPIHLRANVTMICGCPIAPKLAWQPQDFQVTATINGPDGSTDDLPLSWDADAPDGAPSQFIADWTAPSSGIYEVTVVAQQPALDNVGLDRATLTVT